MRGTQVFFLICCLLGGAVLLAAMTSLRTAQTPASQTVAAGYHLWRSYGCEGCHSIYGQGGTYGPDLTGIYAQRGDTYLREFIANPAAFHPNQRIMPRFGLTVSATDADGNVIREGQTEQVVAFLQWVGQPEHAGNFPPRVIAVSGTGGMGLSFANPEAAGQQAALSAAERGRQLFSSTPAICSTCHSLEPDVVVVGPSLYGIADRAWYRVTGLSAEQYIRESIINPGAYVVDGFMDAMQKNLGDVLTSDQLSDLIAFLMTLEEAQS